jgi:type IV secretory pathway VirB10-like protein
MASQTVTQRPQTRHLQRFRAPRRRAVGQELSQTGSQITRRNLNVQPTIKVPVGYKFTVRVNRDILFKSPYESVDPQQ